MSISFPFARALPVAAGVWMRRMCRSTQAFRGGGIYHRGFGTLTLAAGSTVVDNTSGKADIRPTVLGLAFIAALRPVDFRWDYREDYRPPMPAAPAPDADATAQTAHRAAMAAWTEACTFCQLEADGSHRRTRFHHGLIAQEVREVLATQGIDFGGFQDHAVKGGEDVLSLGYDELIAPLIKAVQELAADRSDLRDQVQELAADRSDLRDQVQELRAEVTRLQPA